MENENGVTSSYLEKVYLPDKLKGLFKNNFSSFRDGLNEKEAVRLLVTLTEALKPYSQEIFGISKSKLTVKDVAEFLDPRNEKNWHHGYPTSFGASSHSIDRKFRDPIYNVIDNVVFGKKAEDYKRGTFGYIVIDDGFSGNTIKLLDVAKKFTDFDKMVENFRNNMGDGSPRGVMNSYLKAYEAKNLPNGLKNNGLSISMNLKDFVNNVNLLEEKTNYYGMLPVVEAGKRKFGSSGSDKINNSWAVIVSLSEKYPNISVNDGLLYLKSNPNFASVNGQQNNTNVALSDNANKNMHNNPVIMNLQKKMGMTGDNLDGELGPKTALLAITKGVGKELATSMGIITKKDYEAFENAAVTKNNQYFRELNSKKTFDNSVGENLNKIIARVESIDKNDKLNNEEMLTKNKEKEATKKSSPQLHS